MSEGKIRHRKMPSCYQMKKTLQIPITHDPYRRVSLYVFQKGSLTVEASFLLPFLLCAVTALLFLFTFTSIKARDYRSLVEKAELLAVTVGQADKDDPYIRLYDPSMVSLPFADFFPGRKLSTQRVIVRAWTGYTGESFHESASEALVYMTPEGEVCHRSCECTYLRLSIRSLSYGALDKARNQSGGKYASCEYCVSKTWTGTLVYITDYGSSYHAKRECQGLKRTVMAVPWSQVQGVRLCSKCGGT